MTCWLSPSWHGFRGGTRLGRQLWLSVAAAQCCWWSPGPEPHPMMLRVHAFLNLWGQDAALSSCAPTPSLLLLCLCLASGMPGMWHAHHPSPYV